MQIGLGIAVLVLVVFAVTKTKHVATAAATDNVHGGLWSYMPDGSDECINGYNPGTNAPCAGHAGNLSDTLTGQGLGWANLNSTDDPNTNNGGHTAIDYGVTLTPQGTFTGEGWSSDEDAGTIGGYWVDFAPSSGYPSGLGTHAVAAQIDPSQWATCTTACPLIGWIRYIPGEISSSQITGNWDGWVSLSGGKQFPYGVTYNKTTGAFSGDAWGDAVAGWVSFDDVTANLTTATCGTADGSTVSAAPTAGLCPTGETASAVSPTSGGWSWTCTGNQGNPATCSATNQTNTTLNYCIMVKTGTMISYPQGSQPPAGCTPITGQCLQRFEVNNIWYGPIYGGTQCVESACPLNPQLGFTAIVPSPWQMDPQTGMCILPTGTGSGQGGIIQPIYKEN